MITEDYVSFEVAKLLKEKGFDEPIQHFYKFDSKELYRGTVFTNTQIGDKFYNAPTHQMTMKWLRKMHNISIEPSALNAHSWAYTIYKLLNNKVKELYNDGGFDSYEEATETAIKYCLENLI